MKKILIIRLSSIGDIVLTTPVVRCLKTRVPEAEIHYLTKKQNQPLLQSNPYIDKVWLYDKNFSELLPRLRAEKFDFIADLHKNFRSRHVRMKLRKPSGTFSKLNLRKWIIVNFKVDRLPEISIVDRYFEAVRRLGVTNDGKGLDYFIPSEEEVDMSLLPPEFSTGFVAFVIGGKHTTKILPEEKVAEIIAGANKPVVLLGGMEDMERAGRITASAGKNVFNACGKLTINQSASLIRQSAQVVTNDTGLMHIAAAFGKKILSVWGNTIPEFGMYPYLDGKPETGSEIFEVKGLRCRPCSKIGFEKCPKGHFLCMNDQDAGAIIRSLNR
ncbi:MAG: glycosyltransferase family 9 protein [Bacteroidetes bacterium]|nr:glycosyltransferase family 9 protein [Bacteroidota bacterium]